VVAALLAVWVPTKLFAGLPSGSVSAQVWHVWLKLGATYLLAVGSWVFLLGWAATLFGRQKPPAEEVLVAVPVVAGPPGTLAGKIEVPIYPDEGARSGNAGPV
jgi:hypothetical protein